MISINWKSRTTWTGIAAIVAAAGGYASGQTDITTTVAAVLAALGLIFLRDAIKPAAVLLLCVGLASCNTLPVEQASKESAGRSKVDQAATTIQNDLRDLLPKSMKIESPGSVSFIFNFYGNERSSDISQTNSGSTTSEMASTQGTTATPTASPTTNVTVPTGP